MTADTRSSGLSCASPEEVQDAFEDENSLHVIGGDGQWALFQRTGPCRFEDPDGSREESRSWESDQGYFCERSNIVTDIRSVLATARAFWEAPSYDEPTWIGLESRRW